MDLNIYSSKTHLVHQEARYKIHESLIQMYLQHGFDLFPANGTLFWRQRVFHMRRIRAMEHWIKKNRKINYKI